eukprot:5298124-Prymnesium_polylepis.1
MRSRQSALRKLLRLECGPGGWPALGGNGLVSRQSTWRGLAAVATWQTAERSFETLSPTETPFRSGHMGQGQTHAETGNQWVSPVRVSGPLQYNAYGTLRLGRAGRPGAGHACVTRTRETTTWQHGPRTRGPGACMSHVYVWLWACVSASRVRSTTMSRGRPEDS